MIILEYGIKCHINETQMRIIFPNSSFILCKGLDEIQKLKSIAGITSVWIEEAIEFSLNEFLEVDRRVRAVRETYIQIILSFNPTDYNHWLRTMFFEGVNEYYDQSTVLTTTIDDNKFAKEEDFKAIDRIQDEGQKKIYRRGEWAVLKNLIYSNWDVPTDYPATWDQLVYGMDFGYNDPNVLIEIRIKDQELYVKELIYKSGIHNADFITECEKLIADRYAYIFADPSRPEYIEEFYQKRFNCKPARNEVLKGIDSVKRHKLHIHKDSVNLLKEIKGYKWKEDKNSQVQDAPSEFLDHSMDAMRYAIFTYLDKQPVSI
jgi:phage terminase large subunit